MVSYVTDAALILDEISTQSLNIMLFSGDGPAGLGLLEELSDDMAADGLYVTSPRAGSSFGDFEARYDASGVGSIKAYVLTSYDSIMMLGQAAAICTMMADEGMTMTPSECIAMVGDEYEGASGLHTFLENGDVGGAGYDICGYAATTTDDGAYTCIKYWTATDGVQDA